jgi:hypothetical protein
VDDYLATLWRYASQVTSRVAAAEAALRHERDRQKAEARITEGVAAQAGGRIGLMLAIAQQEADEIIAGARQIAERALEEAIDDAAVNHPIVREAREQADRLLLDAIEESRRIARERHEDIEAQIAQSAASLESLRHQQGEIIGAMLRLRALLGSEEIDRVVTELARAGVPVPPPRPWADPLTDPLNVRQPQPTTHPTAQAHPQSQAPGPSQPRPAPQQPPVPPPGEPPPGQPGPLGARGAPHYRQPDMRQPDMRQPDMRQADVAEAEPYPSQRPVASAASAAFRRGADEDIIDAEIVEEG